jgi:ankyrin repeat protein
MLERGMKKFDIFCRILAAMLSKDGPQVRQLLVEFPEMKEYSHEGVSSLVQQAATDGNFEMVETLLDAGVGINMVGEKDGTTALGTAVDFGYFEVAKLLLSRGADPNLDRTLFSAINKEPESLGLEFAKLLVENGADVNRVFTWFGDNRLTYTPLTFAIANGKTGISDYLRSKGAVLPRTK